MGFRGRYKNARDANEADIIAAIEARGISVYRLDRPTDLLCAWRGVNYLVEVKNGPKARLTKDQNQFFATWPGACIVLASVEEADAWADSVRK